MCDATREVTMPDGSLVGLFCMVIGDDHEEAGLQPGWHGTVIKAWNGRPALSWAWKA